MNEDLIDFFKKRKNGAEEIAKNAKEKGGPSILTYYHFAAKKRQYFEAIEAIKQNKKLKFFKDKFITLKKTIPDHNQKEFQQIMGELEVWGEVLCKLEDSQYNL